MGLIFHIFLGYNPTLCFSCIAKHLMVINNSKCGTKILVLVNQDIKYLKLQNVFNRVNIIAILHLNHKS